MKSLTAAEIFKEHLLVAGALDPEGVHQEFRGGSHGRKVDFGVVKYGTELFDEWVDLTVETLRKDYLNRQLGGVALLSVANGTNKLVPEVADRLGAGFTPLLTQKEDSKNIELKPTADYYLRNNDFDLVVVLEDVGTTGGSSRSVAELAIQAGAKDVEVLNTWQRSDQLMALDQANLSYGAIIHETLPKFTEEECWAIGYCSLNWKLIDSGNMENS